MGNGTVDELLYELKGMCGCLEISDLRFDPFNKDAIIYIESNSRIKRAYSSDVIDEAQAYLKNKLDRNV